MSKACIGTFQVQTRVGGSEATLGVRVGFWVRVGVRIGVGDSVTGPTSPRRGEAGLVTDARAWGEPAGWTHAHLGDGGVWRCAGIPVVEGTYSIVSDVGGASYEVSYGSSISTLLPVGGFHLMTPGGCPVTVMVRVGVKVKVAGSRPTNGPPCM
eukprot:361330-Chlamydomonas_euryale.AAC.8